MPQVLQYALGPGGTGLPDDGSEYCGPTAMTMNIAWLGLAGHSRLAPTTQVAQTQEFFINLDQTLGGLSQDDPFNGTTVSGLRTGVNTYLKMKGYSGNFTSATAGLYGPTGNGDGTGPGVTTPTFADLTTIADNTPADLHFGSFLVGWYETGTGTLQRNGGHFLAIVGTSGSNTVVINNPYPNLGMPAQQTILLSNVPNGTSGEDDGPPVYDLSGYLNASEGMQYPAGGSMPAGYSTPVIEQWLDFTVPLNAPALATWELDQGNNFVSIGLASQEVLAPIADSNGGASAFLFSGGGTLTFTREATHSGGTSVSQSTLISREKTGTPFGSGDITLTSGTLALRPRDSGETVDVHSGGELKFYSASRLSLDLGAHGSLTFRLGSFFRSNEGTLVIAPQSSSQSVTLGGNVKVLVENGAPDASAGMVSPAFVGEAAGSGFFLTYDATNGFVAATTVTGDINTLTGTPIYAALAPQNLTGNAAVTAIQVNSVVTGSANSTLTVGVNGLDGAGVIFNGGSLGVDTLDFGSRDGYIYTGAAGGAISSTVTGSGTNGVNFFGPGTITVSGSLANTGPTQVRSGTLSLGATGSISGGTSLIIGAGATFDQAGSVNTNAISVLGTRMGAGDLAGNVTVEANGTFSGAGTITGTTFLYGTLTELVDADDPSSVLTFAGDVTIENEGFYYFNLASLTQMNLNDYFAVNGTLTFAAGSQMGILFNAVDDPSTGNSFWNSNQTFLVASATTLGAADNLTLNALDYANGYFWVGHNDTLGEVNLHWQAVPEPATGALLALCSGWLLFRRPPRRKLEFSL